MSSKKVKAEELENVNGGLSDNPHIVVCEHCEKEFNYTNAETRTTGSGCDEEKEAKCPYCNQWMKI